MEKKKKILTQWEIPKKGGRGSGTFGSHFFSGQMEATSERLGGMTNTLREAKQRDGERALMTLFEPFGFSCFYSLYFLVVDQ